MSYLVWVAYEKPEIALRVALTYNSKISHDFDTVERSALTGGVDLAGTTTVESPQSVNLEFQSGVAKDTLVFGSIRWVDWSNYVIDPTYYTPPSPLVSYDSDTVTYTLGVGRRFNEHWEGAGGMMRGGKHLLIGGAVHRRKQEVHIERCIVCRSGRDGVFTPPPGQNPASGFPAPGSHLGDAVQRT